MPPRLRTIAYPRLPESPMRRLFTLALVLPGFVAAATLPPVLQNVQQRGAVIGQSFPGPDGLTGWVVQISGRSLIVYTTPSGNYALNGVLIDKSGMNLSQQYEQTYIPHLAPPDIMSSLDQDPLLVEEGQAQAPLLYVFADANCSFCNRLWNALRPYVQSGKLRVRWAMLAFLKDTSEGRAAAILAAKDRVAALTQDEDKFDKQAEEGGIPLLDAIPTELRAELALHTQQMGTLGGQGTPLILFRRGGQWLVNDGLPKDLPAFVAGLDKGT